ncbi:uncharacterized protein LOC143022159 isoform X2 [Oratosquilla oratoria]|uniref:uncharacterized protein LOC143022159 isoform X2 n=1 Tax=Oratosquilla oratoria TaxID=337810 RepID=UPI003F7734DA
MENSNRGYVDTKATLQWASVEIERLRLLQKGVLVSPQAEPSRLTQLLSSLSNGTSRGAHQCNHSCGTSLNLQDFHLQAIGMPGSHGFDEETFNISSRVKTHVDKTLIEVKQMVEDIESRAVIKPGEVKKKQIQRLAGEKHEKLKKTEMLTKFNLRQGLNLLEDKKKGILEPCLHKGEYSQLGGESTSYPLKQSSFNRENVRPNPIFLHSWLGVPSEKNLEKAGHHSVTRCSSLLHSHVQPSLSPSKVEKNKAGTTCQKHHRLLSSGMPQDGSKVKMNGEEKKKNRMRNNGDATRRRKGKSQNKIKITKNGEGRFLSQGLENQKERKSIDKLHSEQVSTTVYTGSPLKKQVLTGVTIHPDPSLANSVVKNHAVLHIQHSSRSCPPHTYAVTYCEEDLGTQRMLDKEDKSISCAELLGSNIQGNREREPVMEMQQFVFSHSGQDGPSKFEDGEQTLVADEDALRQLHFQDTILQNLEEHLATLATVDQVLSDKGPYVTPLKLGDHSSPFDGHGEKENWTSDQTEESASESHISPVDNQMQDISTPVLSSELEEEKSKCIILKCETPAATPISSPRNDINNISTPKFMSPASSPEHTRSKEVDIPPPSPEPPYDKPSEVTTPVPSVETSPIQVKNTVTIDGASDPKEDITIISLTSPVISLKHPTTPEVTPPQSPIGAFHSESEKADKQHKELQDSSKRDDQQDIDSIQDVQSSYSSEIPPIVMYCSSEFSQATPSENSCICVDVSISEGELPQNTSWSSSKKDDIIKKRRKKLSELTPDLSEFPRQSNIYKTHKQYLQSQCEPGEMHTGSTDGEEWSHASENLSTSQSSNNVLSFSFESEKSSKSMGMVIDHCRLMRNNWHLSSEVTPDVTRASECGYTSSGKSEIMLEDMSGLGQLRQSNERLLARMEGLGSFTLLNRQPNLPN